MNQAVQIDEWQNFSTGESAETFHILLVEDNPADVSLIKEALEDASCNIILHHISDGEQAIRFLQQEVDKIPLRLILLDLNLPKKNGLDVLEAFRKTESSTHIPVIILSMSNSPDDIDASYRNCANCYISKPVNFAEFEAVVRSIEDFWLNVVSISDHRE